MAPAETTASPLVSIGVPTYDRPQGLRHTLECLTQQTHSNIEILISNNASPNPETDAIIESFRARDPRIKAYKQAQNIGAGANFEFVLSMATGKYFLWFADDDSCAPEFIAEMIACLESDPDVALAMCDVRFVDAKISKEFTMDLSPYSLVHPIADWTPLRRQFFSYPTSNIFICIYGVYRLDLLKQCTPLNFVSHWKKIIYGSEVPLLAQIATLGKIVSVPKILKTYKSHGDSLYETEQKRLRGVDRIIRNTELRLRISMIAARSPLPLTERLILGLYPWPGAVKGAASLFRSQIRFLKPQIGKPGSP